MDTNYDFADVFDDTYLNTKLVIPKGGEGWACGWGKVALSANLIVKNFLADIDEEVNRHVLWMR